jgi:hypothetical protein
VLSPSHVHFSLPYCYFNCYSTIMKQTSSTRTDIFSFSGSFTHFSNKNHIIGKNECSSDHTHHNTLGPQA